MNIGSIYVAIKGDTGDLEKSLTHAKDISMKAAGIAAGAFTATFAAGMIKVASIQDEFTEANNKIAKSLGISTQEAKAYNAEINKLYGQGLGQNVGDVAETVSMAVKTLSTNSKDAVNQVSALAMRMEDAYGADRQETISAVNVLMTKFGLDSKAALDFVAKGFQSGLNSSGDFLESVTEYAGKFSDSGLKADEFFSILKTGLAAGVLGTDKAADLFKEFAIRIVDGSKLTADSLRKLGIDSDKMAKDLASGAKTSGDAFKEVMAALNDTDDVLTRNQAGVGLLGTQYEDLGDKAALAINTTAVSMSDLAGASESLTEKTYTFAEAAKVLNRELELIVTDVLDQYGTSMSQLVSDFVKYVQDHHDAIVRNVEDVVSVVIRETDELTETLINMKSVYDALPDTIVGAAGTGLAARVVFGAWKPAMLASAIYTINEGMTTLGAGLGDLVRKHQEASGAIQNIMDVFSGKRDWNTGVLVEDMKALGVAAGQTVTQIEAAAGRQIELNNAASTGIKNSTSGLWEYGKAIKGMDAEEEKALGARKARNDAARKSYDEFLKSQDKSYASSLAKQEKQREASAKKAEKDNRAAATEFIRLQEATFETVYRAYEDFRGGVKDIEASITDTIESEQEKRLAPWGDYFGTVRKGWEDLSSDLVGRIAPELADGVDSITINALDPWTDYFVELDGKWVSYKDGIAEYKGPIAEKVAEVTEEAKDPWKEFFDDMKFSWDDLSESALTAMEDIVSNGRSQLSDGFFGLLKGDMDSFSDVWKGFWDDLLRVASDVMAEITIKTAIGGLGDLFGFGTGDSKSSGAGGGILGSLGGTAIGKGASKVWGWLTGGGAAATTAGTAAVAGEGFLAQAAAASMAQNAAAGGAAAGSGIMGSVGALMTNPWTWAAAAALLGGGMIARNAMTPEKRQSIDDTDFNFFDEINLNSSAANGGGDPMYAELANEAARAAQGDVVRMMDAFMAKVPEQLRDGFKDSLSKMSVHLGGGGMQIREDWLGQDTQVMYQGTLYAMFVDTFDPMIQMMEKMKAQYGIDSTAFVDEGKKLQQDFFSFDPEGFWTGEYQGLFNSYYDWFNRVQEYQSGLAGQIDTAVAAQEATIKAGLTMADIVKGSDKEHRDIFQEYDKLFRDLGPLTEGYREWETAKLQKEMEEMARITGNQVLAQKWYGDQLEDLYEKIAAAYQKQYGSQEAIANLVDQQLAAEIAKTAEIVQEATAKPNAPNGYSYATYGLQTGGLTFEELTERKKALWGHGYGFADGGLIDRLLVPRGEDGLIGVQYGEGIVSRQGMAALEAINNGSLGSARPPVINVYIGNEKLDARIDYRADVLMTKKATRPGMDRRRAVR